MTPSLPDIKPVPIKERSSVVFLGRGELDVIDGAFVLVDKNGIRMQIPVGGLASLMLEPGSRVSHAAVTLASKVGCLLVFVGEGGVRLYSVGHPGGARSDRLLYQARLALDEESRLKVVKKMFSLRFGEDFSDAYSVEQLRGLEGVRVREGYRTIARDTGVIWNGRRYDPHSWGSADLPNRCLSTATASLYGICEAAVLAAGYSPSIGFLHTGKPLSFVYDIADLFKFETVVPAAFKTAALNPHEPEREVRYACRDLFRETHLLKRIIPTIEEVLAAGGISTPAPPDWVVPPAIPVDEEG
ncbi:type I-E CRISPR-associated endonuclease Cas1 [Methanospirillum sp. J.3.6.1-F.2.7.3]|uniref:CRISPR-associated endonuclease Cas1 n=1 Tax=Methanospirillum purgamenti TaxID=2834276 RepID=A0A8E7EGS7_9EURY|nr:MULTISPECIES: type I-E CRISPR-associated endonuclease Cas1e [Methanospirillum]MDX8551214.1 type I-E CRISPR-associated endonuclease Cas1e [Methanospirillum hungatei]QVV88182.1 type I-E CRISPR-associated endonuclease Cas1 [Methanospirillum sp. J.3.6.1-F.2.7.3]